MPYSWADELRQNAPRYHLNNPHLVNDNGQVPSAVFSPSQFPNAQPYPPTAPLYAQPYAATSQAFVPTAVPAAPTQNPWTNPAIPIASPVSFPSDGAAAHAPPNTEPMYAVPSNPNEHYGPPRRQLLLTCCVIC